LKTNVQPCASYCSNRVLPGPLLAKSRQLRDVAERPLRVASGPSPSYQANGRFRAQTGRFATTFQKSKSERLLFPEADVQISSNPMFSTAANSQKQTLAVNSFTTISTDQCWESSQLLERGV
jgi:hypothetical protein